MEHFKARITIGRMETDPGNTRKKVINFRKGRKITKWYRGKGIEDVLTLVGKTRFAKFDCIEHVTRDEYVKGVEKHHEY